MEVYMDEISNIKFSLTPEMAEKIVRINNLKTKLHELDNDEEKRLLEEEIEAEKKKFISEFKKNNKKQISKYLKLKEIK